MENLHISEPQAQQGQPVLGRGAAPPSSQPSQLPPQMFTTAAQLLDLTDKKLMVALRDGRKLIGVLRSWDQFANLVLQDTVERIFAHPAAPSSPDAPRQPGLFADVKRGVFLVRGENVLLLGEIDLDRDDDPPPGYEPADVETVTRLSDERKEREKVGDKARLRKLATLGFEGENMGEVLL
ncbi:LSM domain-containing protein [Plectosphaerella plurivora]|uniref:U6 snRNA-associated Sm-like protein LSm1 n=1 Tax=Plectosphaerella plurivora TaxID=936078 RepID=A0A9P8VCP4_9PEZI|nr:LSM domain-containing protein [Plectosphaerella plurivora]